MKVSLISKADAMPNALDLTRIKSQKFLMLSDLALLLKISGSMRTLIEKSTLMISQ